MKSFLKIFLLILICGTAEAQPVTWMRYYDPTGFMYRGTDVVETQDSAYVFESNTSPAVVPLPGPFYSTNSNYYTTHYPLYSKDKAYFPDTIKQFNPGYLGLSLYITEDMTTRDTLFDNPTKIFIIKKTGFYISTNKKFDLIAPTYPSGSYTDLIVQDTALLYLGNGAMINLHYPNRITLQKNSILTLSLNSVVTIKSGGLLCDYGAKIRGPGVFNYKAGTHTQCRPDDGVITFEDSTKLILDSNAVLEVPDSTTLKFKGNQTALKLTPTSKLKMGVNSKLVFEDGARMISRNSTLIAKDTTKKWGGIFSYDDSPDTIVNTKIINAVDGINLIDKFNQPNIIQDCEFINKCSGDLSTGIYIYNSEKTLIRGNHFYSETSGKFDNAFYLEYCTANELNVIDNNIEDCTNGIIDIGSWSYIARNIITGDGGTYIAKLRNVYEKPQMEEKRH